MHRYPAFHGYYYRAPYNYRHVFEYPWHAAPHEPQDFFTGGGNQGNVVWQTDAPQETERQYFPSSTKETSPSSSRRVTPHQSGLASMDQTKSSAIRQARR
jgi:hypothetical protein